MIFNVVLVRWSGGYHEVVDTVGLAAVGRRVEKFLSRDDAQSVEEATRAAEALFAELGSLNESLEVEVHPQAGEVPILDYEEGDTVQSPTLNGTIATFRVVGFNFTEDENGKPTVTPVLVEV